MATLHGMQKVRGSNPRSSIRSVFIDNRCTRVFCEGDVGNPAGHLVCGNLGKKYLSGFAQANRLTASEPQVQRNVSYVSAFLAHAGLGAENVTPAAISNYISQVSKDHSAKTAKNHLAAISRFCEWLIEVGLMESNPCRHVKTPRVQKPKTHYIQPSQWCQLVREARRCGLLEEVLIALTTGLRASEMRLLKWEDVDMGNRVLHVWRGKSRRHTTIPMCKLAYLTFRRQYRRYGHLPYVFPGGKGGPGGHNRWTEPKPRGQSWWRYRGFKPLQVLPMFQRLPKGSVGRGWHQLRHSFATSLILSGVSITKVSRWLGHSSLDMTMRYLHLSEEYDSDIERIKT